MSGSAEQLADGARQYGRFCSVCHGDAAYGSTVVPDLRRSVELADGRSWATIVQGGALKDRGMVGFAKVLDPRQIESIRLYVIKRAHEDQALGAE